MNRWVPAFGGKLDKEGFVKYVRSLSGRDFTLDGDSRIADKVFAYDVRSHVASLYYSRYLAKREALGAGLRHLREEVPSDYGELPFSRWVAWIAWVLPRWRSELHRLPWEALRDSAVGNLRGRWTFLLGSGCSRLTVARDKNGSGAKT